jgi:hypothetical protein
MLASRRSAPAAWRHASFARAGILAAALIASQHLLPGQ